MKTLLYLLLVVMGLSACSETNDPYGAIGWKDTEDLSNIESINPNGDTLRASRLEIFGNEGFLYALLLGNTGFSGTCENSEGQKNEEELTPFRTNITFQFPEKPDQNFSVETTLMYGINNETNKEATGAMFLGDQLLPKNAIEKFTSMSKLDIIIRDLCGKSYTKNFNISGHLKGLLSTLEQRKKAALDKEVDEAFQ